MTSTRTKLEEAAYFLSQMKVIINHKEHFQYNLSACVSALRSITLFMQTEYAHAPGFSSWYAEKQEQMRTDKLSKFFNQQRVLTIHEKPIATRSQYQFYSPAIDTWKLNPEEPISFSITAKVEEDGTPTIQMTNILDPTGAIVGEASAETQWLFDDLLQEDNPDNKDVVTLCEEQLAKIQALVLECEARHPL